ncbi:hypothetical protein ACA910_000204 [Epithemia clementina (nom. ined.)]
MEEANGANIVVPQQMSVGELRQWLIQFAEGNREHYENNMVQKKTQQQPTRFEDTSGNQHQHSDHNVVSTSRKVSSASHGSLVGRAAGSMDELSVQQEGSDMLHAILTDKAVYHDEDRRLSHDDSIVQSLGNSEERDEGTLLHGSDASCCNQQPPQGMRQGPKQEEEYRIVSIRKLLEAPKPIRRQGPAPSWDEFLDDDFSDPYYSASHPTSFVWHPSNARSEASKIMMDKHGPRYSEDMDSSSSTQDESTSTSSVFVGSRPKKATSDDENDSLSAKSRSSNRSLRSRLPMLLCKSAKEESNTKLVQRTYHNGPMATHPQKLQTSFRPLSPHPLYHASSPFLQSRLNDNLKSRGVRNNDDDDAARSTVSCPDFAAASAYLHKFSNNNDHQQRTRHQEQRQHRFPGKKQGNHGTSAILPGAVDPALEQIFNVDDDGSIQRGAALKDDYKVRPSAAASHGAKQSAFENVSRVSEKVSKFGGQLRRGSSASTVQLRQQELERQWATNRPVQHVKKVKWQASSSTGNYKKKIVVVDPEPSE